MGPSPDEQWRRRRTEAAAEQAAAQERREEADAAAAAELLAGFVSRARSAGLPVTALRARAREGGATYRTGITGWYLKRNHALGVGEDGAFYVLNVPASLRSRWRGADLTASRPSLVVGRGGRDGESMPLADLLALRLAAGASWD